MTYKVEAITDYDFKPSDKLLLDANIWLFVYGLQKPRNKKVDIYSQALVNILKAKSCIYIDVLIVSEFINTCARRQWEQWKLQNSQSIEFKIFRKNKDFKPIAQGIAADVKRMLQHCVRIENGFESLAIDVLIDEFGVGNSDFNDQVLTALCKRKELMLVTDDGDFKGCGVPLITANTSLLA